MAFQWEDKTGKVNYTIIGYKCQNVASSIVWFSKAKVVRKERQRLEMRLDISYSFS